MKYTAEKELGNLVFAASRGLIKCSWRNSVSVAMIIFSICQKLSMLSQSIFPDSFKFYRPPCQKSVCHFFKPNWACSVDQFLQSISQFSRPLCIKSVSLFLQTHQSNFQNIFQLSNLLASRGLLQRPNKSNHLHIYIYNILEFLFIISIGTYLVLSFGFYTKTIDNEGKERS